MLVTAGLWGATYSLAKDARGTSDRQFKQARIQLALAREEFIASHRPRIALRRIYFDDNPPDASPENPRHVGLWCVFANIGETDAHIVGIDVDWAEDITGRPPPESVYDDPPKIIVNPPAIIESGGDYKRHFPKWTTDIAIVGRSRNNRLPYFIHGKCIYTDSAGTRRETGFCRLWDREYSRFKMLGPGWEGYEYEN